MPKAAHCTPDVASLVLSRGEGQEACVQVGQKAERKKFHSVLHCVESSKLLPQICNSFHYSETTVSINCCCCGARNS